ncbi:protein kinase, partial [Myxococcota bacterium]|nr:protein kinase [Myxococcota bacterium]MBU1533848.1 protein kinase [Myxococcota bacterium]
MKICPQCHKHFPDEAHFCPKDGAPLAEISDPFLGKTLLGQFQIEELIGQGSMGKVYLAKQVSVDRHVAVKILKRKLASDPNVIKRFQREAKAAARLNHPNIITIHLVGETEDDHIPYMVMEYVQGSTLELVCKAQGAIDPLRVLTISRQIILALHEAHRNGVVHRDLKPENINILKQGTPHETAKVLDFGIAKILHSSEEYESQNLTKTGTIFGTPAYISPEQASGEPLDHRTDLYSLGVIMFRMATGRLPFEDASGLEVLVRHIKEIPPAARSFNPDLPDVINLMVEKLLKKDRNARYQSTEELLMAVDAAIIALGGITPSMENTGPTSRFTPGELRTDSSPRGEVRSGIEELAPPPGKGLQFFVVVFFGIIVLAALVFGALKFLKGGNSGGSSSKKDESQVPALSMTAPVASMKTAPPVNTVQTMAAVQMPVVKACDFLFEQAATSRKTCFGSTVEIKVVEKGRNLLQVELYIPGMVIANATVLPIDVSSG